LVVGDSGAWYAGSQDDQKGPELLLQSMIQLKQAHPQTLVTWLSPLRSTQLFQYFTARINAKFQSKWRASMGGQAIVVDQYQISAPLESELIDGTHAHHMYFRPTGNQRRTVVPTKTKRGGADCKCDVKVMGGSQSYIYLGGPILLAVLQEFINAILNSGQQR